MSCSISENITAKISHKIKTLLLHMIVIIETELYRNIL